MKTVYFIRHAKAADKIPGSDDKDRDLATKGQQDAQLMSKKQKMHGIHPDLIISSTALRALNTAKAFAEVLEYPEEKIQTQEKLYNAEADTIHQALFELGDHVQTVEIFGHNPGISELVIELSGGKADILPTCGIAYIEFNVDQWQAATKDTAQMVYQDFPAKGISG